MWCCLKVDAQHQSKRSCNTGTWPLPSTTNVMHPLLCKCSTHLLLAPAERRPGALASAAADRASRLMACSLLLLWASLRLAAAAAAAAGGAPPLPFAALLLPLFVKRLPRAAAASTRLPPAVRRMQCDACQ